MGRQHLIVAVGVIALAALWLSSASALLSCPPATRDALLWVQRGAGPGWLAWALGERHFVGYRPLAALSYTLNVAALGTSAEALRAVDLGLFVLAGGLLAALARRWLGALPALAAAAVYFLHPVGEEIAVDVARRSYTLSASLLLGGLLVAERRRRLGAGLLGAAILCNEMAVVPALLAPLLLGVGARPFLAAVAAVAALRLAILQGGGGYGGANVIVPWAAGGPLSEAALPVQVAQAAGAGLYHTLLPVSGDGSRLPAPMLILAAPIVAALLRAGRLGQALLAWYLGYAVLAAVTVTWFWRMAYPPLLPMCLAAALLVHRRQRMYGAMAALGLSMVMQGPLARGPRPLVAELQQRARLIDTIESTVASVPPDQRVLLALPYTRHWAVSTTRWLALRMPARSFALIAHPKSPHDPVARAWDRRPGTVKLHEDAVLLGEGEALGGGARLVDRAALPEDAVLVWVGEEGAVGWLP